MTSHWLLDGDRPCYDTSLEDDRLCLVLEVCEITGRPHRWNGVTWLTWKSQHEAFERTAAENGYYVVLVPLVLNLPDIFADENIHTMAAEATVELSPRSFPLIHPPKRGRPRKAKAPSRKAAD